MLLVCGFTVPEAETTEFTALANRSIELLTAQPGCQRALLGHSTDEPTQWVLTVEFASVVAYRRAMSPFEVREHVIPLLSRGQAAAYELVADATEGRLHQHTSLIATDAATVRPGDASGPATPRP